MQASLSVIAEASPFQNFLLEVVKRGWDFHLILIWRRYANQLTDEQWCLQVDNTNCVHIIKVINNRLNWLNVLKTTACVLRFPHAAPTRRSTPDQYVGRGGGGGQGSLTVEHVTVQIQDRCREGNGVTGCWSCRMWGWPRSESVELWVWQTASQCVKGAIADRHTEAFTPGRSHGSIHHGCTKKKTLVGLQRKPIKFQRLTSWNSINHVMLLGMGLVCWRRSAWYAFLLDLWSVGQKGGGHRAGW